MNNESRNRLNFNIIKLYLSRYVLGYIVIGSLMAVFELVLIIRTLLKDQWYTKWYNVAYFICYVVLFVACIITILFLIEAKKRKRVADYHVFVLYTFCFILLAWSFAISYLDCLNSGHLIVFLTIVLAMAALVVVNPFFYMSVSAPLAIVLYILATKYSPLHYNAGYLFNYFVFNLFAILTSFHQYRINRQVYLNKIELEYLNKTDQLTKCYTRLALNERIKHINSICYFGLVDVDDFKSINDTYGHEIGDQCLIEVVKLLKEYFGNDIYRFGGDEFAILSPQHSKEIIENINKINEKLKLSFPDMGVHISGGFYEPQSINEKYEFVFNKADEALYFSKEHGRSQTTIYKEDLI